MCYSLHIFFFSNFYFIVFLSLFSFFSDFLAYIRVMFIQVTVFVSCKTQEIVSVVWERCIFRLSTKPHNNRCSAPCFDLRYQDLLPEGTQNFWFLRCCLAILVCDIAFFLSDKISIYVDYFSTFLSF